MTKEEAITIVREEYAKLLEAHTGFYEMTYDAWRRKQDEAKTASLARLMEAGAVIRDDWQGARFRFQGIACTCTSGLAGALGNWLRRAEVAR